MKFRTFLALVAITTLFNFAGCRLGYTPYDECAPTFPGGQCDERCDPLFRAGSPYFGSSRCYDGDATALYEYTEESYVPPASSDCKECNAQAPVVKHAPVASASPQVYTKSEVQPAYRAPLRPQTVRGKGAYEEGGWEGKLSFPNQSNNFNISLQELQREDPSITDVRIINSGMESDHGGFVPRL